MAENSGSVTEEIVYLAFEPLTFEQSIPALPFTVEPVFPEGGLYLLPVFKDRASALAWTSGDAEKVKAVKITRED